MDGGGRRGGLLQPLLSLHLSAGAGYSAGYVFAQLEDWQVFYQECRPRSGHVASRCEAVCSYEWT